MHNNKRRYRSNNNTPAKCNRGSSTPRRVKAAANGTYNEDYNTRLDRSREIAGRLKTAPLNLSLTWQAYYSRWKPAITYCLPITTFSSKECKKIQSPFFMTLLPKIGINRHMPRALLHGPPQVAGLGLIDLESEQLSLHVTGLISQLRKNDRVGQTMTACIDALQLYLGTEDHFFTLQAHAYEIRPDRKENQLVYIWEELTLLGCQLVSNSFWTPTRRGDNDVAIMDAVLRTRMERQGTTNHLPAKAIWYVNACRLYLNVTMLHKISTSCGSYVCEWALDGSRKNPKNKLLYPHQDRPPPHAWRVWRECLLATFLKRRDNNLPTLNRPIIWKPAEATKEWRESISRGMRLEEAVQCLPGYLKEAMGTIHFPQDNGERLSQDIKTSSTCSWTDGTVKDSVGAHSYTIRPKCDRDELCISGSGVTPGDPTAMTSLRAEHYGILVVVILLDIVTIIHGHDTKSRHLHYTDSKAVISRLEEREYMSDKKYDCTDYDIWMETVHNAKQARSITFEYCHVKGHQRETMHTKNNEQGPLTRQATYNDWCDLEADREREDHLHPSQLCAIEGARIYLKTKSTLVTSSAYTVIYGMKTKPATEEYVCHKLGLTKRSFDKINWVALGSYFQALAISQKVKVMKFIYDWQNVGLQKQLHGWADADEYSCPYECGRVEYPLHYLCCPKSCKK